MKNNIKLINNPYLIWVAYNEELTLKKSVESGKEAIKYTEKKFFEKYNKKIFFTGIICCNGCTDDTPLIAKDILEKSKDAFPKFFLLKSERGMVKAQQKCIDFIEKQDPKTSPIIFLDSDAVIDKRALFLIIEEYIKHPKLKAVGAHPMPLEYKGFNVYKRIMSNVLNFRSNHPESEIAIYYSPEHHPYADSDPQPIGVDFEKKSKIYFHGRCFSLINTKVWDVDPEYGAEDIYMGRSIPHRFGPGKIRVLYQANVYFYPLTCLKDYIKTYTRQYHFLKILRKDYRIFNYLRNVSKTKLDASYQKKINLTNKIYFTLHLWIKDIVYFLFKKNILKFNGNNFWNYRSKKL